MVKLDIETVTPPLILYTMISSHKNYEKNGIVPNGKNKYVKLYNDFDFLISIKKYHQTLVKIYSKKMHDEGMNFYKKEGEKHYLIEYVPPRFIAEKGL